MKRIIVRFLIVGMIAFCLGVGGNQFRQQGFHWKFIANAIPDGLMFDSSIVIPADSAFAAFLTESVVFIDIRTQMEYQIDHIPQARNCSYDSFVKNPDAIIPALNCNSCLIYGDRTMTRKAYRVARYLERSGFTNVAILENGYGAWLAMDFPIESKGE